MSFLLICIYHELNVCSLAVDDVDLACWLIENGADVNAKSTLDEPPLALAIRNGSIGVSKLLLIHGTDISHGNLLHCAAERKNQSEGAELATILAQKGANVNAYRYDNDIARPLRGMFKLFTPLHVACLRTNIHVARILLQYGADPHRKALEAGHESPPTVLDVARSMENQELLDLFSKVNH